MNKKFLKTALAIAILPVLSFAQTVVSYTYKLMPETNDYSYVYPNQTYKYKVDFTISPSQTDLDKMMFNFSLNNGKFVSTGQTWLSSVKGKTYVEVRWDNEPQWGQISVINLLADYILLTGQTTQLGYYKAENGL